jgi:hypothetical protein
MLYKRAFGKEKEVITFLVKGENGKTASNSALPMHWQSGGHLNGSNKIFYLSCP